MVTDFDQILLVSNWDEKIWESQSISNFINIKFVKDTISPQWARLVEMFASEEKKFGKRKMKFVDFI